MLPINNSTIKGIAGVASAGTSTVIINDSTIEIDSTNATTSRHVFYTSGTSTITVNNSNITAVLGSSCSLKSTTNGGTITIDANTTIN